MSENQSAALEYQKLHASSKVDSFKRRPSPDNKTIELLTP